MNINWTVRVKNRQFWVALIPAVILLAQAVAGVFGVTLDLNDVSEKLLAVVEAAFVVLTILGIVNDPTTAGLSDSSRAMRYEEPRKSAKHMG